MKEPLQAEIRRIGGEPSDPTWHWFLLNGPHGPDFTWGQTKGEPPGYVGVEHLRKIVAESIDRDPGFVSRATSVVRLALSSENPIFLRRAIQVASVLGDEQSLQRVATLATHPDARVAKDARACLFLLRHGLASTAGIEHSRRGRRTTR